MEQEKTLQVGGRNPSIDLIKSLAILCVLFIHACGIFYDQPVGSTPWTWSIFWGSLSRSAVPLFFMASGALMLNPKKNLPLKRLYGKNILRILIALFFWASLYKVFDLIFLASSQGSLPLDEIKTALKDLVLFRHKYHLYFLVVILLFYICLPVARLFVAKVDKKLFQYSLGIWFIFGILYWQVLSFWPFNLLTGSIQEAAIPSTWALVGYCFLGFYLLTYPLAKKTSLTLSLLGLLITFFASYFFSIRTQAFNTSFLSGTSLGVCLFALGNFSFLLHYPGNKWTQFLSKASFAIYLTHVFFLTIFMEKAWIYPLFPLGLQVPVLVLMTLAPSILSYLVLSKIPLVNKWLI